MDTNTEIKLSNEAIKREINEIVKRENLKYENFSHSNEVVNLISQVSDPKLQSELIQDYLNLWRSSQTKKDKNYDKLIANELEVRKTILEMEQERRKVFVNPKMIMFFMIFPIAMTILLSLFDKTGIGVFLTILWYGISLAFYFSQENALNNLIKTIKGKEN